ncbi:hypothetical protein EVAR_66177_1 [Eumeta japonica]|uniref:Uncharacterized protein n=1 Tax=Eumeta variegata TaxID=151549 RepID=A0A4C1ZR93_EUMVA|nr:hypothetical protein EVAR_66177_1 [Eumeta japonica]
MDANPKKNEISETHHDRTRATEACIIQLVSRGKCTAGCVAVLSYVLMQYFDVIMRPLRAVSFGGTGRRRVAGHVRGYRSSYWKGCTLPLRDIQLLNNNPRSGSSAQRHLAAAARLAAYYGAFKSAAFRFIL